MTRRRSSAALLAAATLFALSGAFGAPAEAATGDISVALVDAVSGQPVPYGCVEAWESPTVPTPNGPFAGSSCTSAADGLVTLTGLVTGTAYYLHATSVGGYADQWAGGTTWYDAAAHQVGQAVTVPLEKQVPVSGTVTHADLTPAAGVAVSLNPNGAGRPGSATSAPDGTWSLSVDPGDYTVQFTDQGSISYAFGRRSSQPADVVHVPARTATTVDDVLPAPTVVDGTVTEAATGQPLSGACASLLSATDPTATPQGYACTDADGHYRFTDTAADTWRVQVTDPTGTYAFERSAPFTLADGQQVNAPPVALSPGVTVTGTVVDWVSGAPLAGVCVDTYLGSSGPVTPGEVTTCSGPDGTWKTDAVHPGAVVLGSSGDDVHVPGFAPGAITQASAKVFSAVVGSPLAAGVLRLHKGAALTGRITDNHGRPVVGATVGTGLMPTDPSSLPYAGADWRATRFTAVTDAQGRYSITRIEPMRQAAVILAEGQPYAWQWSGGVSDPAAAKQLTFAYDSTTRLDAELRPAAPLSVVVTAPQGAVIAAYTASGALVGWPTWAAGPGTFAMAGLPQSSVRVAFAGPNGAGWYNHAASLATATPVLVRVGKPGVITLGAP